MIRNFVSASSPPRQLKRSLSIIHEESDFDQQILNLNLHHPAFRGSNSKQPNYGNPNEILNGPLVLLSSFNGPQRIIMSVIRTTVDHFALVYRYDRNYYCATKRSQSHQSQVPLCCINLRGVWVERAVATSCSGTGIVGFTLRPKNPDYVPASSSLMFLCPDESMLSTWVTGLSSSEPEESYNRQRIPRKSSMPMVEEEDEEDLETASSSSSEEEE